VFLFATNFRAGTIDFFYNGYNLVTSGGGFWDPGIPPGLATGFADQSHFTKTFRRVAQVTPRDYRIAA
jgi:hypothetical protein